MEKKNLSLPALGALVPRRRLLDALAGGRTGVLLIEAPAGYGKTSLALQFATSPRFEEVVWFDGGGRDLDEHGVMQSLVWQLRQAGASAPPGDQSLCELSRASLEHEVASALSAHWSKATCVVLDNLCAANPRHAVEIVRSLMRASLTGDQCLVVTSRLPLPSANQSHAWLLEPDDLRFSREEARECAMTYGLPAEQMDVVAGILDDTSGHPALFAVMLRSLAVRGGRQGPEEPGRQLVEQLEMLLETQCDHHCRRVLHATALLGSGSCADLEDVLREEGVAARLRDASWQMPLLRVEQLMGCGDARFFMHDVGRSVFGRPGTAGAGEAELYAVCLDKLAERQDHSRLLELLLDRGDVAEIEVRLDALGADLIECGAVGLIRRALAQLPRQALVRHSRILLLEARSDRLLGRVADAAQKASLVAELAEQDGDLALVLDARILVARSLLDQGRTREAVTVLRGALQTAARVDASARPVLLAHLAAASVSMGDSSACETYLAQARRDMCANGSLGRTRALVDASDLYRRCVLGTDYKQVLRAHSLSSELEGLDLDSRLSALLNLASAFCWTGRLDRAEALLRGVGRLWRADNPQHELSRVASTRIELHAGRGDYASVETEVMAALERDDYVAIDRSCALAVRAACRRIKGDCVQSFADAEEARDLVAQFDHAPARWQAGLEVSASLLALGDTHSAREDASRLFAETSEAGARCHSLCAALVLAEADRQAGQEPTSALADMKDYIVAGNGVWHIAMYVRAFPALFATICSALGSENVPVHLLELLRLDGASAGMERCRTMLPKSEYEVLARRLGEGYVETTEDPDDVSPCRVRLFGGLQVSTGDGPVRDSDWKKRKARLLFTMLVVRKGKDVPREQLLEYLWPEMDDERARANFYVVWNNMKRAVSPNLEKGKPSPYIRAAGGVCRVDDILVSTDLDDFEQCLLDARRADSDGDRARMIAAFRRLAEIYRGDLLPGDIYDDWFAPLRERCRQEFSDAMLSAAKLLEEDGDRVGALQLLRQALTHDAWREDLYQAALRCQIASGQRSAAIDTYMTCMHKLSEDLGLDPSAETRKLYDQVLAMEQPPEEGYLS